MVHDFQPGETWEMVTRRMKSQEMNIRRVRRSGYTFEIGASDADFHFFYERMHQPLISGRHSGYGRVDTEANLYRIFKNGNLIFILDSSGKRVAGGLNLVKGNAIMGVANGLLDGDEELLKTGALSALYYYILKWCNENHIRRFDLGEVRPFENNGLYQYKRRWGFMAIEEIWNTREWIFWAPGLSPAAMRWIEANRFIPIFARSGGSGEAAPIIENDIKETRPDPV
jgi:predicted N-acyltransferase